VGGAAVTVAAAVAGTAAALLAGEVATAALLSAGSSPAAIVDPVPVQPMSTAAPAIRTRMRLDM
jgi:hypothetical protein